MLLDPFSVRILAEQRMKDGWRAAERARLAQAVRGPGASRGRRILNRLSKPRW